MIGDTVAPVHRRKKDGPGDAGFSLQAVTRMIERFSETETAASVLRWKREILYALAFFLVVVIINLARK